MSEEETKTTEELDAINKKAPKELTTPELIKGAKATIVPELTKELEGIVGDAIGKVREDLNVELTNRIEKALPHQKAWAANNIISREAKTGLPVANASAVHVLSKGKIDFNDTFRLVMSEDTSPTTVTKIGDSLAKERQWIEDNGLLDIPMGRGMAVLGLTPRDIYRLRDKIGSPIYGGAGQKFDSRGTVVTGSGAGSYLTFVQYIGQYLDYLYDTDEFYIAATHIPVETGSGKYPRNYRSSAGKILGSAAARTEGSAPGTEGTKYSDQLSWSLINVAGYITVSREIADETMLGIREMVRMDVIRDLAEQVQAYSMSGTGSSQPYGLYSTTASTASVVPHTVLLKSADDATLWNDVREARRKLGGKLKAWSNAPDLSIVCNKDIYWGNFKSRTNSFGSYMMTGEIVDGLRPIVNWSSSAGKAAITLPREYFYFENLALTTMAMGYGEGKTLVTENELLFFMNIRYDSKSSRQSITSDIADDLPLVILDVNAS